MNKTHANHERKDAAPAGLKMEHGIDVALTASIAKYPRITMKRTSVDCIATTLALTAVTTLAAEDAPSKPAVAQPPPAAATATAETAPASEAPKPWWESKIPEAFTKGKLLLNARLRYEYADQSNLRQSHAPTIRTRLGYETAPLYGFRGLFEIEDITIIGNENNYNQAGLNPKAANRTVISDPETTEVNQAWIGYENYDTLAKYGRQRITLDDHRFVGNVGWRQNEQTFDSATIQNKSLTDTTLFYGYVYDVDRVTGDDHPTGDYDSRSHLIHVSNSTCPYATLTAYSFLLDFDNAAASSSASYGMSLSGDYPIDKEQGAKLIYRAQYAFQTDYGDQPIDYEAHYYRVELGGTFKRFELGTGYEVLGSDHGIGFSTPLATLHSFNGWADLFLTTPAQGLEDVYAWAGVNLPWNMPLKVVYHRFHSDRGSDDYGQEWDAILSRKFGKHWIATAKYAYYDGDEAFSAAAPVDVHKAWVQLEFVF